MSYGRIKWTDPRYVALKPTHDLSLLLDRVFPTYDEVDAYLLDAAGDDGTQVSQTEYEGKRNGTQPSGTKYSCKRLTFDGIPCVYALTTTRDGRPGARVVHQCVIISLMRRQ